MSEIQITEETEFNKVPAQDLEQAVRDMAIAMEKLAHYPELRVQMGKAGRRLVDENFNWQVVGKRLNDVYRKTLLL